MGSPPMLSTAIDSLTRLTTMTRVLMFPNGLISSAFCAGLNQKQEPVLLELCEWASRLLVPQPPESLNNK
jgi:hypothetical protein